MNFFLPDTNVIKSKDFSFEELYKPLNFSAVVITELRLPATLMKIVSFRSIAIASPI